MPTLQFLQRSERILSSFLPLYSSPRPRKVPPPPPKQPSEWDFIDAIMIWGGPPSCSESSQSLSSDDSDDTSSAICPVHGLESFPKFDDQVPSQQDSAPATEPQEAELDLPEYLDLDAARDMYEITAKNAKIRISLPMANKLVSRLRKQLKSAISQHLLASSYYAAAAACDLIFASKDAADIILEGVESALESMLYSFARPGRSVSRTVQELEKGLIVCVQRGCAVWSLKWVLGRDATKRERLDLEVAGRCMEENGGVRVLVRKAEECMRDVVGMMIWVAEQTKY